jgi:hypothetical protein
VPQPELEIAQTTRTRWILFAAISQVSPSLTINTNKTISKKFKKSSLLEHFILRRRHQHQAIKNLNSQLTLFQFGQYKHRKKKKIVLVVLIKCRCLTILRSNVGYLFI